MVQDVGRIYPDLHRLALADAEGLGEVRVEPDDARRFDGRLPKGALRSGFGVHQGILNNPPVPQGDGASSARGNNARNGIEAAGHRVQGEAGGRGARVQWVADAT